jgi:REP element-mobilizing transposase RayT
MNYDFFLRKLEKYLVNYFEIYAYCLLENHFHLLLRVKAIDDEILTSILKERTIKSSRFLLGKITYSEFLEDQFKRMFSSYALAYNSRYGRKGSLFQKRFKRIQIKNDEHLMTKLIYIHHNPMHHFEASDFTFWNRSSFNAYFTEPNEIVTIKPILDLISDDVQKAKKLLYQMHEDYKVSKP